MRDTQHAVRHARHATGDDAMTDWYYHDPIEGRVGPLPADQLRARYGERRIQLDTLVWHHGLREWSALERQAEALDLHSITPDASLPPPLPRSVPPSPPRPSLSSAPYGMVGGGHAPMLPKKGMSGCLIALIVAAALSVPVIAILAAIAIPQYQQYVVRSKVVAALAAAAPVRAAIEGHADANTACPGNGDAGIGTIRSYASPYVEGIETGSFETGLCGIAVMLRGAPKLAGKHLWLERQANTPGAAWVCSSDLDASLLPATCRTP